MTTANFALIKMVKGKVEVAQIRLGTARVNDQSWLRACKSYLQFRFDGRHLESVVNSVGRHRHCHVHVGRFRTGGGSR